MYHNLDNSKARIKNQQSGFGLVELMVSIGIVVLVTSIIIVRHNSYNGAVLLRSEAYELALQARDIQLTAVSVSGSGGTFRNVYGLYFNSNTSPGFYYSFRDANNNEFWNTGEEIKRSNVDPRFEIDEIRLVSGTGESTVDAVSVVFERPNFDARFYTAGNTEAGATVSAVEIDVRVKGTSRDVISEVRTVEITKTGQITVQ